jgi:hypothetical protein
MIVTTMTHGQVSVGTSAVQLTTAIRTLLRGVTIKSIAGNSGKVYVGNTSAVTTSTGYELSAGNSAIFPTKDPQHLWIISDTASQMVCWFAG